MLTIYRCHGLRKCHKLPILFNQYSAASYSNSRNDGNGKKKTEKTQGGENKLPDEKLKELNKLLKSMPSSSFDIVNKVQMTKPIGYKALQKIILKTEPPKNPAKKPDNFISAAKSVAAEIGEKKVQNHLLQSVGLKPKKVSGKNKVADASVGTRPLEKLGSNGVKPRLTIPKAPAAKSFDWSTALPISPETGKATMPNQKKFNENTLRKFDGTRTPTNTSYTKRPALTKKEVNPNIDNTKVQQTAQRNLMEKFVTRSGSFTVKGQQQTLGIAKVEKSMIGLRRLDTLNNKTSGASVLGSRSLNIFDVNKLNECTDSLKTWEKCEQYILIVGSTFAPRNYFEKMILWTNQGKIWKFPIDNEDGLDKEHSIPFTEHIFMEDLLEPWCPTQGAVRNFMELVCVGLSKNPYYTVEQKREHIQFYRNYFDCYHRTLVRDEPNEDDSSHLDAETDDDDSSYLEVDDSENIDPKLLI